MFARMIALTGVNDVKERDWLAGLNPGRELDFEEDDLERPTSGAAAPAPTVSPDSAPPGVYFPVMVNLEDVREFYPRNAPRVGTRIVYKNGAARPVKELYEDVQRAAFNALAD